MTDTALSDDARTFEPPPDAARPFAASTATRLMCAGARLDPQYRERVISELRRKRHRVVAPAYGYDTVAVLAHALAARSLHTARITCTVLAGFVVALLAGVGPLSVFGAFWLFVWAAWAACFFELAANAQNLITHLKAPRPGYTGFDGTYPNDGLLPRDLVRKIVDEQDASSGLVYYGGYSPFVGAGFPSRTQWSFAVLLNPPRGALDALAPGSGRAFIPFTVAELTNHVEKVLREELGTDTPDGRRITQLTVDRRRYRKALGTTRAAALGTAHPAGSRAALDEDRYDAAREYLCVRVGSWAQELVVSLFVSFDVRGGTLYSELHHYVLPPIAAAYHAVDQLPDRIDGPDLFAMAGHAAAMVAGAALEAVGAVLGFFKSLAHRGREAVKAQAPGEERRGAVQDYGALVSIRQLAATPGYHHFFQESDADKYAKIVERRLLETVREFLERHNVDTAEFREREASVLNIGIANTGTGTVVNSGVQSFGKGSSATGGTSK